MTSDRQVRRLAVLDMDGVVNCEDWLRDIAAGRSQRPTVQLPGGEQQVLVEPAKVGILNMLARPGIEWLLSSTWRGDGGDLSRAHVQSILEQLGWRGKLIGSTPILRTYSTSSRADWSRASQPSRGDEIAAWLEANGYGDQHLDALHKFAARIGLHRRWFQPHKLAPHYDLTIGKRARAVAAGAIEVSTRAMLEEMRRLRGS